MKLPSKTPRDGRIGTQPLRFRSPRRGKRADAIYAFVESASRPRSPAREPAPGDLKAVFTGLAHGCAAHERKT